MCVVSIFGKRTKSPSRARVRTSSSTAKPSAPSAAARSISGRRSRCPSSNWRRKPPIVFYCEHDGLAAKYGVRSEADFAHECSPQAWTVWTAARFAQPSRLAWSADEAAREAVIEAISRATPTLLGWTLWIGPNNISTLDLWKRAFQLTFGAELRAERGDRSAEIVDADPQRYERFAESAGMLVDTLADRGP